ncbi:hypothetical protein AB0A95_12790 [Micromonospora sp. NPDC049230]
MGFHQFAVMEDLHDNGRPAPWPDDIEDWTTNIRESPTPEPF